MRAVNWGSRPRLYDFTASRLGKPAAFARVVDFPAQRKEGAQASQDGQLKTKFAPRQPSRPGRFRMRECNGPARNDAKKVLKLHASFVARGSSARLRECDSFENLRHGENLP